MTYDLKKTSLALVAAIGITLTLPSCLTAKKMDAYVASQYNNELPKPNKRKKENLAITSTIPVKDDAISKTVHKRDKLLPLLVYWKIDHRTKCSLNPNIAVANFSNAVNNMATKGLQDKLNGHKLELTVEQAPENFSIVVKENIVWVIYTFMWSKVYIEPDAKDLVVAYKVMDAGNAIKTGKIRVKNPEGNKGIRLFQSWKSATSEYLSGYNASFTTMTKTFVNQLTQEL